MKYYIYILILLFIIYLIPNRNFNYKNKISVIILNHKRPHNLKYSIPKFVKYKIINEIIIDNGDKNNAFYFKHPKVKIINQYELNSSYGAARRFMNIKYVKNKATLFLDDDIFVSEYVINKLYHNFININKNTIYGPIFRGCYINNGYLNVKLSNIHSLFNNIFSYNNVSLTGFALVKTDIVRKFMTHKNGFTKYRNWFIKHKGNCEDLALNKFIKSYYNEKPVFIKGNYIFLDKNNGYSSNKSHLTIRNEFCKKYK
jgi:hypothetical protein